MRYSLNNYVGAFTQAIKKSPHEEVINGFVKLLNKTGDIKYSKKVLEAIHRHLVNEKEGKWVNIETARELSQAGLEALRNKFTSKDHLDFKLNSELVAGVRITIDGEEELNNSLQNKLNKLFR